MVPLFAIPAGPELLILVAIVVLLFGASKLPQLARSSGQAIGEFKRGRDELEAEIASAEGDVGADGSDTTSATDATTTVPAESTEPAS